MTTKEKKRDEYLRHREKYLARSRKQRETKREQIKEYLHNYYLSNQEKLKQYQKEYTKKNKEQVLQKKRDYHAENRAILLRNKTPRTHARRAKLCGVIGENFTLEQWEAKKASFQNKCAECKLEKTLTVDHITSLSRGGSNSIDNIQPLCLSCNTKKR